MVQASVWCVFRPFVRPGTEMSRLRSALQSSSPLETEGMSRTIPAHFSMRLRRGRDDRG